MILRPVLCRPFVGRRAELAYLRERRLEAGASRGSVVFIAGAAGLGKSRLVAEFCRSLTYSRWRITFGPCREFGGSPYGPILSALSNLGQGAAQLPPAESKRQYFEAIVERFAAVAARKALVVVIEDLHWADAATLDLLEYLAGQVHRMRILILVSFRLDDLHAGHAADAAIAKIARRAQAARIDLEPLEGVELRTFIDEALTGFTLSREIRQAVALAGEGNPFFTEELLKNAVQQAAERGRRGERWQIPHSVRTALLERLRPFEGEERRIITQAAVIGRTFALELLATIAGVALDDLVATLRRARDFQLIDELEPGVFRFRHGLTREALCGNFLRAELRPLHRKIALTLEGAPEAERPVEALAYHWWAAGDAKQCTRYNELAGDAARRTYAHDDAIAFYNRALEPKSIDPFERGSILEKIANLRLVSSQAEEGQATYGAAAELFRKAGAFEREAACRVRAAMTAYTIALSDTSAPLEAMLTRLDPSEYVARARLHLGIAWLAIVLRFPTRAQTHLLQVDPRAIASATDIAVRYHHVAAAVATALGDAGRFRREHAAWLEAARAHGDGALAGAYYNGAKYFSSFGLHDEALESIDSALRVARESRNRHAEECAHATAALCYLLRGDLQGARAAVEAVPTTTDNRVNTIFAAAAGSSLGSYLGDSGLIEKWFDGLEDTIMRAPEIECGHGFAELLVRRGRHADAAALLNRVLPDCELVRGDVPALLAVASYGSASDRTRAREQLLRATQSTEDSLEHPALKLFDALAFVRDGQPAQAPPLARAAAEGFRRFRTPLLEASALEVAGDVEGALALYRRCGAIYHANRLDGAAEAHASPSDPLGTGETAILSSREREIALLAARGHSNLEIARSLSISHKTVEKHLGSVYLKLGVSSRRALRSFVGAGR
ncbi:MAG TPA: AAA family ATPase [Candidatus Cybelea sp.]|nr:AAA family ATPase [Candidatus Cybelea sp.]